MLQPTELPSHYPVRRVWGTLGIPFSLFVGELDSWTMYFCIELKLLSDEDWAGAHVELASLLGSMMDHERWVELDVYTKHTCLVVLFMVKIMSNGDWANCLNLSLLDLGFTVNNHLSPNGLVWGQRLAIANHKYQLSMCCIIYCFDHPI